MRLTIAEQYLGFTPLNSHLANCGRAGTNLWEVARIQRATAWADGSLVTETITRMVCTLCGVVHQDRAEHWATEATTTDEIGYGSKPKKCAGLWLHPGPLSGYHRLDDHGPDALLLTGSRERPTSHEDVIGIIGWYRPTTGRRDAAIRWWAGLGLTDTGSASTTSPDDLVLKSRTAAARWVAEQHAAQIAVQLRVTTAQS